MKKSDIVDLSWDDFDEMRDPRPAQTDFDAVVERAISRRGFLGGALAWMALVLYMLLRYDDLQDWLVWVSFIYPVLYVPLSIYLDWKIPRKTPGEVKSA